MDQQRQLEQQQRQLEEQQRQLEQQQQQLEQQQQHEHEHEHGHERHQPPYERARGWSDDGMSENGQEGGVVNWNKVARIVCAVLLPPLGVFLQTGCSKDLAINALLTLLGYLPGIVHALFVILMD